MTDRTMTRQGDLGAVFDAHVKHEFVDHDVEATMRTMVVEPYVHNVPALAGGIGQAGVRRFYKDQLGGEGGVDKKVVDEGNKHEKSRCDLRSGSDCLLDCWRSAAYRR